jgi:hypothetical protein
VNHLTALPCALLLALSCAPLEPIPEPTDSEPVDSEPEPTAPRRCDDDGDQFGVNGPGCLDEATPDCDDSNPAVNPDATELCDGVDNDCSGAADEPWDNDGDGDAACATDCDDDDPSRSGLNLEVCDGADNDCDDQIDEGYDQDGDGQPTCRGDCDDLDPAIFFGAEERCDGLETDCDPFTADDADLDQDGLTRCEGDCDDLNPNRWPGATEVCDGVDNDCDGVIDPGVECAECSPIVGGLFCADPRPWEQARDTCTALGGSLAVVLDEFSNLDFSFAAGTDCWIGLSDLATEGQWQWVDGAPLTFAAWAPGEPNDAGGEDCAATNFQALGAWNDWPCLTELPFVCGVP